jgi:VWFA-related protein
MLSIARLLPALALAFPLAGQAPAPQSTAEISQQEAPATFRARVNLVMVPVVVRSRRGDAVGNLTKDDFILADRGKPQEITRFTLEKTAAPGAAGEAPKSAAEHPGEAAPDDIPTRFVAYVFDDIHIAFPDLVRSRDAASRHFEQLVPSDRAAIFTTSGQTVQEFTDDRATLRETLLRIQPRPIARSVMQECPDISYYMGDLIFNKHDPQAIQAAVAETIICMSLTGPTAAQQARQVVDGKAQQALLSGQHESRVALSVLRDIVRRMAGAPGQRIVILASPGFLTFEQEQDKTDLMERAARGNVIINTLDARGLYVDPMLDASRRVVDTNVQRIKSMIDRVAASQQADVLAEIAAGTGGAFFQNNNDLAEGYRRLGTAPEFVYLLGFAPQNLKLDGSFHALKVTLKDAGPLTVQARRGYYAPKHLEDAAQTAQREIEEAMYSREEMHDLPVEMRTQFFKSGEPSAKLAVLAHLEMNKLRFRKADGRNYNTLTVVSGIFDRNGNYLQGIAKTIEFRLKDDTLENRMSQGVTVRTSFDVKPGTYMVRLVVRDSEGQLMSAANGAVEIP